MAWGVTADLSDVFRRFSETPAKLDEAVATGLQVVGLRLEREVKPRTPYLTGRLRQSIGNELSPDGKSVEVGVITPVDGSVLIYAPFVEYGTRYMTPRLYLTSTFEAQRDNLKALLREQILKVLEAE